MFYKDMLARSDKRLLSVPTDLKEDDEDAENSAKYKMLKLLSFHHNFRSSQLNDVDIKSDNDEDIYNSGLWRSI